MTYVDRVYVYGFACVLNNADSACWTYRVSFAPWQRRTDVGQFMMASAVTYNIVLCNRLWKELCFSHVLDDESCHVLSRYLLMFVSISGQRVANVGSALVSVPRLFRRVDTLSDVGQRGP